MQSSSTSKTEVKKRIERYLEALKAVSQQDPDSFAEIAPELIQRSTLNWRGSDPFFAKSLNEWLTPKQEQYCELNASITDKQNRTGDLQDRQRRTKRNSCVTKHKA